MSIGARGFKDGMTELLKETEDGQVAYGTDEERAKEIVFDTLYGRYLHGDYDKMEALHGADQFLLEHAMWEGLRVEDCVFDLSEELQQLRGDGTLPRSENATAEGDDGCDRRSVSGISGSWRRSAGLVHPASEVVAAPGDAVDLYQDPGSAHGVLPPFVTELLCPGLGVVIREEVRESVLPHRDLLLPTDYVQSARARDVRLGLSSRSFRRGWAAT